jgi:hypothetical protein
MNTTWYCTDCEARIERAEIDDHEQDGHHVRGRMRPDRLIGNNPWDITVHDERGEGR